MKRFLAVLTLVGAVAGGTGVAWAQTSGGGDRAARREAFRTCVHEAKQAHPDATRAELKDAVKSCLQDKGITPRQLTPEQQERRAKLRSCVQTARSEHPDADRHTIRQAVKECMKQS
jgi:hypothetical protein